MDEKKEKVIEAAKTIRDYCRETSVCKECPFHEENLYLGITTCGLNKFPSIWLID